ncbi:MAG: TraB/GumN family protein [Bacteroidota bacterium]
MRQIHLFSLFIIIPLSNILAQNNTNNNSIFWEISGNGLKSPSYLYGTIHIQDKRVFSMDTIVMKKFNLCQAYAMELLIDKIDPVKMREMIMLPGNKVITNFISKTDSVLLFDSYKANYGGNFALLNRMKPFFISSQLMQNEMPKDMPDALDMYFLKLAKKANKTTLGIEELSDQLGAIEKISIDEQVKMLMDAVKDTSKQENNFEDLLDAYLNSNLDEMLKLSNDTTLPENFNKAFLIDRNKKMAKNIAKYCTEQITFNAIGAAHLGGKEGVVELLRKKGYTVKPILVKFNN